MKTERTSGDEAGRGWWGWLVLATLLAACAWFWIVPLFRPRGIYFWGYYRFPDIYLGLPTALAALSLAVVLLAPRARRRRRALQMTTLFLATVLTLYGLDFVYLVGVKRLFQREPSDFWLDGMAHSRRENLPDPELGFVRKPGLFWQGMPIPNGRIVEYRTDENGFRNPPGLTRAEVVFLGDSFTEGATMPEEETFVQKVGRMTGRTVVNLARGGYGAPQELLVLQRYGLRYRPKVVVWVITESTDLEDAELYARWKRDPTGSQPFLDRYAKRSLFAQIVPVALRKSVESRRMMRLRDGTLAPMTVYSRYEPDAPARRPLGWKETARAIETGDRLCRARGIRLILAYLPAQVRVLSPYIVFQGAADRDRWLPGGRTEDARDFGNALRALCQRLGCEFLDLGPALRREAARDNRYVFVMMGDVHLDVDGHSAVAAALSQRLRRSNVPR